MRNDRLRRRGRCVCRAVVAAGADVLLILFISDPGLLIQRIAGASFTVAFIGAAAILFRQAHQSGVPASLIVCDVLLMVSFASIGRAMLRGD